MAYKVQHNLAPTSFSNLLSLSSYCMPKYQSCQNVSKTQALSYLHGFAHAASSKMPFLLLLLNILLNFRIFIHKRPLCEIFLILFPLCIGALTVFCTQSNHSTDRFYYTYEFPCLAFPLNCEITEERICLLYL